MPGTPFCFETSVIAMFVDEVEITCRGGQRRRRLRQLPPREVRPPRRARRRRRRRRRQRDPGGPGGRRQPRRPGPSQALEGRERASRGSGANCHGAVGRGSGPPRAAGHDRLRRRATGFVLKDLAAPGEQVVVAPGRQGRQGQHALQVGHQPRPARIHARRRGRSPHAAAGTEGDRRRGPGRQAQRRQEHAA